MFLAFALAIVALPLFFLYRFMGPEFWNFDPFAFEEDLWEGYDGPPGGKTAGTFPLGFDRMPGPLYKNQAPAPNFWERGLFVATSQFDWIRLQPLTQGFAKRPAMC